MNHKFHEGQQVWVCANLGGQLVREKGMVLGVTDDGILAGSFASSTKTMAVYPLGADGRGENVWLEMRL
jgi:hypothetical protein